jgi:hypothetical protein
MGDGKGHVIDKGKYVEIWKKENGEWKIYADIWNTSLPPAPAKKRILSAESPQFEFV